MLALKYLEMPSFQPATRQNTTARHWDIHETYPIPGGEEVTEQMTHFAEALTQIPTVSF